MILLPYSVKHGHGLPPHTCSSNICKNSPVSTFHSELQACYHSKHLPLNPFPGYYKASVIELCLHFTLHAVFKWTVPKPQVHTYEEFEEFEDPLVSKDIQRVPRQRINYWQAMDLVL